jgi:hypothetical protein
LLRFSFFRPFPNLEPSCFLSDSSVESRFPPEEGLEAGLVCCFPLGGVAEKVRFVCFSPGFTGASDCFPVRIPSVILVEVEVDVDEGVCLIG